MQYLSNESKARPHSLAAINLDPGSPSFPTNRAGVASAPPSQLLEYWVVIRGSFGWICLLALIGGAAGWLVSMLQPSMYQARTVLDIRSLNENFLNSREGSPIGTGGVLPESYIQTEIKILQSESLRKRALSRLSNPQGAVQKTDQQSPSFWQSVLGRFDTSAVPYKDLIADAGRRVKIRAVGNTRIVEVLCDARDAQLAASVCNSVARTYIEYNLESRYESTKETGQWLQSQLDDVRRRLTKAENELKDSANDSSFVTDAEGTDSLAQDKLRQIQAELSRIQAERIAKESDYEIAVTRSADSLPLAMDSGPIRDYRVKLEDLKRQLADLSSTMTPEHYRVREVQREITQMQGALEKERSDLISRLKANYEAAMREESMLSAAYNKQSAQVAQVGNKSVQYNMLRRDVDSERRLYETLLQKVDEVGLATAMRTSTISVVDPAVPPVFPYSPKHYVSIAVGLFAGSCIGLVFSFLRLRSDRSLHGPGEASYHLQLRELGVIPSVHNKAFRGLFGRTLFLRGGAAAIPQQEATGSRTEHNFAGGVPARSTAVAEAFFATMNSLLLCSSNGTAAKVIVLTSPEGGDGKTTVATNLAIALAQIGRRVVVVDGDLRKPRLHQVFDVDPERGLAKLLEEDNGIEQRPISELVSPTRLPNLFVLPTAVASEGTAAKLHSNRLRILLERLRSEFDVVIIDSPPMLHLSDARVLGSRADGVVLVFRARRTTIDDALAAYECLLQDGIRVLGTVLNDWNARKSSKYGAYASYLHATS